MKKIELLAPARDLAAGIAAIDFGADAVYIGGAKFGARQMAGNTTEDIERLVDYARPFGVRIYATLNTIVYEEELAEAEALARELLGTGIDALIVQDMAFMRMNLGRVEFHASTQMCNTTPEKVKFLQESGFSRVILERGLTLEQIKTIRGATTVDLECFVHGAICVGFSGECYLSRTMGSRSGNRGECSQPCRLSYDLVKESNGEELIVGKHLLSVQDLNLAKRIPQLIEAGVTSFKIEGRLKDTDYIKNTVAYYRQEIDHVLARLTSRGEEICRSSAGRSVFDFTPDPQRSFTRGGGVWMLDGKRAGVASFNTPKAMGMFIGEVGRVNVDNFELRGPEVLNAGDGICFMINGELMGTNINGVEARTIYPNKMDGIVSGMKIYRNHDHQFSMALGQSRTRRVIDVDASVELSSTALTIHLTDSTGVSVMLSVADNFEPAQSAEKMVETVRVQVAKSGDTIFDIGSVEVAVVDETVPFIPISLINGLRRDALDALLKERRKERERADAVLESRLPVENTSYPHPSKHIGREYNVVNSLSQEFYRQHKAESVERGMDSYKSLVGEVVMVSAYCIRREIGECPKMNKRSIPISEVLILRRGRHNYRLDFECKKCLMTIRYAL